MATATKMVRLEQWLTDNDETYEGLAEKLGITAPAVHHYIAGRNSPSAHTLIRISEITGIAPSDLIRRR